MRWQCGTGFLTAEEVNQIATEGIFVPDTDADGLSDPWEIKNFGDITTTDGTGDQDDDGVNRRRGKGRRNKSECG